MADNINLTVDDINSVKNIQNNVLSRLDIQNFIYDDNAKDTTTSIIGPLIGGTMMAQAGIRVYAAKQTLDIAARATTAKAEFNINAMHSSKSPIAIATLEGPISAMNKARITHYIEFTPGYDKAIVHLRSATATKVTKLTVHLLVIGYA